MKETAMFRTLRRVLTLCTVTIGVGIATAGPAAAGVLLNNHCEPVTPAGGR